MRDLMEFKTSVVNLQPGELPSDYHCNCDYCKKFMGVLIKKDGGYYNKLDRSKYYLDRGKHVAKTPLHVARWCIQKFTKENDWVLDPTIGAGTTAVESLNHGRNVAGIELEEGHYKLIMDNIGNNNNPFNKEAIVINGDARQIGKFDSIHKTFQLIVNNPPYSGDEVERGNKYNTELDNLAFLKESDCYYKTLEEIYRESIVYLNKGGFFCVGVKDMIKNKQAYLLHKFIADILSKYLEYQGMALLPHYPPTFFMSTYGKRFPELNHVIPRYQTIIVFAKK